MLWPSSQLLLLLCFCAPFCFYLYLTPPPHPHPPPTPPHPSPFSYYLLYYVQLQACLSDCSCHHHRVSSAQPKLALSQLHLFFYIEFKSQKISKRIQCQQKKIKVQYLLPPFFSCWPPRDPWGQPSQLVYIPRLGCKNTLAWSLRLNACVSP